MVDSIKVGQQVISQATKAKRPLTPHEVGQMRLAILDDDKVSLSEATMLQDALKKKRFGEAEKPAINALVTQSLFDQGQPLTATIGAEKFTVKPCREGKSFDELRKILDGNKIDEVYLSTPDGRLFIAHGNEKLRGALNLKDTKEGYIGKINHQDVTVIHVDNETNTAKEGAIAPLVGTYQIVKSASETGIVKGITDVGTTVVALVVGKSVFERGLTAFQGNSAAIAQGAVTAATQGHIPVFVDAAGNIISQAIAQPASPVIDATTKIGPKAVVRGMGDMIASGAKTFGVAAGVATITVGSVALGLSGIGAVHGSLTKPNFNTIKMATEN